MKKFVALTFDDGPSLDTTPKILDIIENIKFKLHSF
ncbi:Polysaccharide deacetylase [Clostridium sp. DSM 8431]|nr:Polysaccharide deacetylase [Clostridium sp. DSM 8431]